MDPEEHPAPLTIVDLQLEGSWGLSLRDPELLAADDIALPADRDFGSWSRASIAGRTVWFPWTSSGKPQAALLASAAAVAFGADMRVVCVDLVSGRVTHDVSPIGGMFYEFLPVADDRVLAIFAAAVAEISPSCGLVWQRDAPDMIVDYALREGILRLTLDDGRELRIDPKAERRTPAS